MPELPDITVYIEALTTRIVKQKINRIRLLSPFLLRTAVPNIEEAQGQIVISIERMGKRIVFRLQNQHALVLHLMIAGRLQWYPVGAKVPARSPLMVLEFDTGSLSLTEAGSKKRASLHFVSGSDALDLLDPHGLEVLECNFEEFSERLTTNNHTLKRALTSPRLFSGIGNAYSDEILHKARLSPTALTQSLSEDDQKILYNAIRSVLHEWTERLREKTGSAFPKKVTAFHPQMAVHGKYGEPCPVCETAVQRIRYVGNETNYCPRCQTNGKLLADRALSRLLKKDWPKTIEELER